MQPSSMRKTDTKDIKGPEMKKSIDLFIIHSSLDFVR